MLTKPKRYTGADVLTEALGLCDKLKLPAATRDRIEELDGARFGPVGPVDHTLLPAPRPGAPILGAIAGCIYREAVNRNTRVPTPARLQRLDAKARAIEAAVRDLVTDTDDLVTERCKARLKRATADVRALRLPDRRQNRGPQQARARLTADVLVQLGVAPGATPKTWQAVVAGAACRLVGLPFPCGREGWSAGRAARRVVWREAWAWHAAGRRDYRAFTKTALYRRVARAARRALARGVPFAGVF